MSNEDQKSWWNRLFSKEAPGSGEHRSERDTIELDLLNPELFDEQTGTLAATTAEREAVLGQLIEAPLDLTPSNPSLQLKKDMEILQQELKAMDARLETLLNDKAELQASLQARHATERQLRASLQEKEHQLMASQHQQESLQRTVNQLHQQAHDKDKSVADLKLEKQKLQQQIAQFEKKQTAHQDDEGRIKELEQLLEDITAQLCDEQAERKQKQELQQALEMQKQRTQRLVILLWHIAVRSLQRGCGRGAEAAMWQTWQELYPFFREQLANDGAQPEEEMEWLSWLLNHFQLCQSLEWERAGDQITVKATGVPDTLLSHDDSPELRSLHTPIPLLLTALWSFQDEQGVYVEDVSTPEAGECLVVLQRHV